MANYCQVTGKRRTTGFNVSHSHRKTKRSFMPNLHKHRFWAPTLARYINLTVSAKGMRIIDKKGIDVIIQELTENGEKI